MKKLLLVLAAVAMVGMGTAKAQFNETNNILYHALRSPQSNLLNPAFFPTNNTFYLSLPGINGQFGFPLGINDIVKYDRKQKLSVINLDTILNVMSEDNRMRMGLDVNLLGFGLKIGSFFFDANMRLVNNINIGLPASTIKTLLNGNMNGDDPITEVTLMDGDLLNFQSYLETSLGAGYRFRKLGLTVGVHAKLLSGLMNLQTDNTRITIETSEDLDKVTAKVYYQIQEAAVVPIDTTGGITNVVSNVIDYVQDNMSETIKSLLDVQGGNNGVAFDLGLKWDLGPFSFSASVIDLSPGIHWQKNVNTLVPEAGQGVLVFNGIDLHDAFENGFSTQGMADSLQSFIDNIKPRTVLDSGDYWFSVPTKINVGASVSFWTVMRAGVLFHGQFDRGLISRTNTDGFNLDLEIPNTFRFNTTLSVGLNLFNWMEIIAASSVVYDGEKADFFNPGGGVIFTPFTALQFYIMCDYISSIRIIEAKAMNVKFGFNLLLGKGGRSRRR
jgi:hypothetical protein